MSVVSLFKKAVIGLALAVPIAFVVPAARLFCDSAACYVSSRLSSFSDLLHPVVSQQPAIPTPSLQADRQLEELEPDSSKASHPQRRSNPKRQTGETKKLRGVLVRRSLVLSAVQRGLRPSGHSVEETSEHPAGLIVYGWGSAGAGLQDGDIITRIGGHRPSSAEDVIAAVASAYRKKVYAVSGTIFRAGEEIRATVELPLPEPGDSGEKSSQ